MEALTIYPQNNEQLDAIKSVLKALKIPFYKSPYNPEYVKKIQESEKHQEGAVILKCEEDISNYFKNPEADVQEFCRKPTKIFAATKKQEIKKQSKKSMQF